VTSIRPEVVLLIERVPGPVELRTCLLHPLVTLHPERQRICIRCSCESQDEQVRVPVAEEGRAGIVNRLYCGDFGAWRTVMQISQDEDCIRCERQCQSAAEKPGKFFRQSPEHWEMIAYAALGVL